MVSSDPRAADAAAQLSGKLLYIEDQPMNVALVEGILSARHPGVQLLHASTGAEGVRMVHEEQPDFVLLDMHLPDTSGLEVVRELNSEIARRGLRVTILTGDNLTMDIIKAMSLGAYEYWVKPISASQLEKGVRRGLAAAAQDPRHHSSPPPSLGSGHKARPL
jgi:DNA-binding response OmpR family regulator